MLKLLEFLKTLFLTKKQVRLAQYYLGYIQRNRLIHLQYFTCRFTCACMHQHVYMCILQHVVAHVLPSVCLHLPLSVISTRLRKIHAAIHVPICHIVSWAVFTCPHFHWFLLNKIAKIGENGGLCDNHAYNACKNQGVAQD